jgi:hypothetical protein
MSAVRLINQYRPVFLSDSKGIKLKQERYDPIHTEYFRSCLLSDLTASELVAFATRGDIGSQNRLDLIQRLVSSHYVCMIV